LFAIRHSEDGEGTELLLDPATGRVAGQRSVGVSSNRLPPGMSPGAVLYVTLWQQRVVDEVGHG